jgi:plastocyanin
MRPRLAWLAAAALLVLLPARPSSAPSARGSLEAMVKDERGKPVVDAVVSLTPPGGASPPRSAQAVMDQHDKTFVPHVLPVPLGAAVTFPNRDNIRHHVYSFSSAKRFELPLYMGTPAAPVVFDKPGAVVLGCNIHDWMVGYIYVLPTPHFARTDEAGQARLTDLSPGDYEAQVWHPRLRGEPETTAKAITIGGGDATEATFVVALKPPRRGPQRPPERPAYESSPQS